MIRETPAGVEIDVRVITRARKTQFAGIRNGAVSVRVAAPPVDDSANDRLIEFLAEAAGVGRRAVRIVSGERGRRKRVAIAGVTAAQVRAILER